MSNGLVIQNENEQVYLTDSRLGANDLLTVYMNYYQIHAEQRMKILEFFITIDSMLFGAAISTQGVLPSVASFSYVAIMIVSLICYMLDKRTTSLIHTCRVALRKLEDTYMDEYSETMHLFSEIKRHEDRINYSRIIRFIYSLVAFIAYILLLIHLF